MEDNREILEALFRNEKIDLKRGDLFDTIPDPMPDDFNFNRVEGMMLGACHIFILMKHGDNLEKALVRVINDTKDNDTIGAIVGAAVGALHGKEAIPERWIKNHSGRTSFCDDGRIFDLLTEARNLCG